jgi:hypothetical protein
MQRVDLRTVLLWSVFLVTLGVTSSPASAACINEDFRTGPSAVLPDCRAYELVTPPDTNGRRVGAVRTFGTPPTEELVPYELASSLRDSIVYVAYSSPLLEPGGPTGVVDVYEAVRGAGGWQTTRRISPPGSEAQQAVPGGISPDHLYAFTSVGGSVSPLALGGSTSYLANPDGTYELTGIGSLGSEPFVRGRWISEGGEHVIFATGRNASRQSPWCTFAGSKCQVLKLESNAPPTGTGAIYDRAADGPTRVVSLLPEDEIPAAGEEAYFQGVSKDASAVAFTIEGVLYVRVDNEETREVAGGEPTFAGLSEDGDHLFYVAGGNVHRFDTETGADEQVNSTGDAQVSNVSPDGSHVYFISKSQIGAKGIAGQPNLYVWSDSAPEYIATLASSDLQRTSGDPTYAYAALGNWTSRVVNAALVEPGPGAEASRTTPAGDVFVFESHGQLATSDSDSRVDVYRYHDEDKSLVCLSCNPLASATADARLQEPVLTGLPTVIHNVTDDGSRVFFETSEALVARDTDGGVNDVYQWTEQEGGGAALDLISSGRSPEYPLPDAAKSQSPSTPSPNVLLSVTPDGKDVVFLAQEPLVAGAPEGGTAAIYDARVNGGFPAPPVPIVCIEEGCRPTRQAVPGFLAPSSETTNGSGNVKPRKQRCRGKKVRSGKRKRCTKRKAKQQRARASATAGWREGVEEVGPPIAQPTSQPLEAPDQPPTAPDPARTSAAAAAGPFDEFGIESVSANASTTVAGAHPDFTTSISLNHVVNESNGRPQSNARTEEVAVSLPPGLIGNPNAVPQCKTGELVAYGSCPIDSQVGVVTVNTTLVGKMTMPFYNLEPPHPEDEVARFGFFVFGGYAVFIDIDVRTAGDYGVTATVHSSPGLTELLEAETTIWGNPADASHDEQRMTTIEAIECGNGTACKAPGGKRASGLDPETIVFMTNPSACQPQSVGFAAKSYQLPGKVFNATAPLASTTDCVGLPFDPSFTAQPTNPTAGAPTGLKTTLKLPQAEDPKSKGTATMREARVTLPEGMTIAAGAADGLAACSDEQVGYGQEVDAACPDASKLGTATITSPALSEPLEGALYQRTPVKGRLFGLWLVTDELGLHVKLPGEIKPNPGTGQLTAVFTDLPQVPVEEISLNVWGGPRAPLKNPDSCGVYSTSYAFVPHSDDPAVGGRNQMTIDQGCGGGFSPELHAGVTRPLAGAFSPFVLDVTRNDGEPNLGAIEVTLPEGELAKLAGVPLCSDAQATSGACPASTKIGSVTVGVGPGPQPLWLPQPGRSPTAVYLAGPYKGAPFSVVTAVPAQAGPFDLGIVVVRSALDVDRETARATVRTDPLPQFIEGVAATYRRLHVVIDRPGFSLNPTNCTELATTSKITSTGGAVATPSSRFQVDGCKALKFKPELTLRLKGGTERGDYPALSAVVKARKGDANIGAVSVALPRSEFLAQEHIETICTRVQFAAGNCPKRSVYGKAKAWTPLLAKPLAGPVYLRSSDNPLPDLVMALNGEIDIALVGRIDSKNGGIRTTFGSVPDAPITRFVLKMRGGSKSLLVNSVDVCKGRHRALVRMRAQNGRRLGMRPVLEASGCGRDD